MAKKILFSGCGCLTVVEVFDAIPVIDTNRLSVPFFSVVGLKINGILTQINSTFVTDDQAAILNLLDFLNDEFLALAEVEGTFRYQEGIIEYDNIEHFETLEIVAIITELHRTITASGEMLSYQNDELIGATLDPKMMIDNQGAQLEYKAFGNDPIAFDPETGTISNIYIPDTGKFSFSFVPAF